MLAVLPKVPTMAEAGFPTLRIVTWDAYFDGIGAQSFPTTPEELGAFVAKETIFWGEQIRKVGIEKQ